MAQPTLHFRQVWRNIPDARDCVERRTLVTQQWFQAEGWEHESILAFKGYWEDLPVADYETKGGPRTDLTVIPSFELAKPR
jgi:hypothetical protein